METIETTTLKTSIIFPRYYNQFRIIHHILAKISYPYIFFIATIGFATNTSTVILLSKNVVTKNLKNKWTLIALALSDLLFNMALFIRGLHDVFKGNSARLCLIISFLSHLAELLSACYTVAFTIQRYTAVRYPLESVAHRRSSPILSLLFIFILSTIFCFALCYENGYVDCHEELKLIWFIADAIFSFAIPFFLILIYNILIVNFIRQHSRTPLSIQSKLIRQREKLKNYNKTYNRSETFDTDNNTVNGHGTCINTDENQSVEIIFRKQDQASSVTIKKQQTMSSTSSLFGRINLEKSLSHPHFQAGFRPLVLSKLSCPLKKNILSDTCPYSLSRKLSHQSNEKEYFSQMSTRTCQSMRVTRMLVLVSTCFLIINAPAHLSVIALKIYTSTDPPVLNENIEVEFYQFSQNSTICEIRNNSSSDEMHNLTHNVTILSSFSNENIIEDKLAIHLFYLAILLTQSISYASYSLNFFLYSFSGMSFRTSLRQLFNINKKQ